MLSGPENSVSTSPPSKSEQSPTLRHRAASQTYEVRHLERTAGLIAASANFELYSDMSARMMAVAGRFAPRQQVYSIDECFLDFEGVRGDLGAIGGVAVTEFKKLSDAATAVYPPARTRTV